MPYADGRFSAVVCFTMLHHLDPAPLQDQAFGEVARVLRPGGTFAGTDSLGVGWLFKLIHVGDTLAAIDPDKLPARLTAAGLKRSARGPRRPLVALPGQYQRRRAGGSGAKCLGEPPAALAGSRARRCPASSRRSRWCSTSRVSWLTVERRCVLAAGAAIGALGEPAGEAGPGDPVGEPDLDPRPATGGRPQSPAPSNT